MSPFNFCIHGAPWEADCKCHVLLQGVTEGCYINSLASGTDGVCAMQCQQPKDILLSYLPLHVYNQTTSFWELMEVLCQRACTDDCLHLEAVWIFSGPHCLTKGCYIKILVFGIDGFLYHALSLNQKTLNQVWILQKFVSVQCIVKPLMKVIFFVCF